MRLIFFLVQHWLPDVLKLLRSPAWNLLFVPLHTHRMMLLLLSHSTQAVVAKFSETEECIRPTARRITARA